MFRRNLYGTHFQTLFSQPLNNTPVYSSLCSHPDRDGLGVDLRAPREIDASPTALADTLRPLAEAGLRLQVFMRYRHFRDEQRAVVEVCPHPEEDEERYEAVMRAAGLKISKVPALGLEGDQALSIEYCITQIVAEQNLHLIFCVTQTVADKSVALIGFESEADAEKAAFSLLLMKGGVPVIHEERGERHVVTESDTTTDCAAMS